VAHGAACYAPSGDSGDGVLMAEAAHSGRATA
jgi:hypothetical protein